jgi:hypothetical protein
MNSNPKLELKSSAPVFEGFVLQMVAAGQKRRATAAVKQILGVGWQVKEFGDTGTDFEVLQKAQEAHKRKRKGAAVTAWAWEKTYRLRAAPGVVHAEPMFTVPVSAPPEFEPVASIRKKGARQSELADASQPRASAAAVFGTDALPESDDPQWSIKEIKVPEAWSRFPANKEPGAQVIIGHPDTGYSEHPEILSNLLAKKGHDYVKNDSDAKDDLDSGALLFPGHGTGTSSVVVSPKKAQGDFGSTNGLPNAVWGVAPGAKLIPIRVSRSVVLDVFWAGGGVRELAMAIEYAADNGAHVVSISMGTGFANSRLLKAVQYAQRRGVIILAAAGNYVPFVVWPAAYSEVIAVAASNAQHKTWRFSSSGSSVDVTAPGESVWCAGVSKPANFSVGRGSGTSYAVATVAGVAALWLSHHGRDKLVQRYGAEKIPIIFNQILRDTCEPMPSWNSGFGRGLVNAVKVLDAALPGRAAPLPIMASAMREHPAIDSGGLATFNHLFESTLPQGPRPQALSARSDSNDPLWSKLSQLLNVPEEELPARLKEIGQELAFHLSSDPKLYQLFADSLSGKKKKPTRSAMSMAAPATAGNVESVRAALLAKPTSKALKQKLT